MGLFKKKNIEKRYREDDDYDDSKETDVLIRIRAYIK